MFHVEQICRNKDGTIKKAIPNIKLWYRFGR